MAMANPENIFSDDVRHHLSFIQGVITRMNSNSFSMKGWMVAIVSALLAVYAAGLPSDTIHAAATALFLYFGAEPLLYQLERIKKKYGLMR